MGFISPWFGPSAKQYCQPPKSSLWWSGQKKQVYSIIKPSKLCHAFLDSLIPQIKQSLSCFTASSKGIHFWSAGDGMLWAKHTSFKEPKQSFGITTAILHLRCADRFGAQSAHTSAFFHFQRLRSDVRIVSKRAKARNFQKQRANMSEPTTQAPKQLTSKRAKLFWEGTIPMQNGKEDHWEVKRWKSKFGEIVELTLLVKFRVLVINILFESGFGLSCSFTRQKSSKYFFYWNSRQRNEYIHIHKSKSIFPT